MAANPTAFSVWHRDDSGTVYFKYPAEHPLYVVVERCIKTCQRMLEHPDAQRAFVTLAEDFEKAHRRAPASSEISSKDRGEMEKIIQYFFGEIFTQFPAVIVDYTLGEPDYMGFQFRREWDGTNNMSFHPSRQCLLFNGQRIGHMAAAAIQAETYQSCNNEVQFNRFLFTYSNVILHGLVHVLITYLGQGRSNSPPDRINEGSLAVAKIDAGRQLERQLLGGTMNLYRIEGTEDKLCGVPYLGRGDDLYRIDQETIDKVADNQIEFPYRYGGPPKDEEDLEDMEDMACEYAGKGNSATDPFNDAGVENMILQSAHPLPNINIDDLWHSAPRS